MMKISKRKQKFIRFLKENNTYQLFIDTFNNYQEYKSNTYNLEPSNLDIIIKHCNILRKNEIKNAFDWSWTNNIEIWGNLSMKLNSELRKMTA